MTYRTTRPVLLVLGARGLAEFLAAVPAYRALADIFPRHKRVLAAAASLRSIVRLCGWFDQLLPVESPVRLPPLERPNVAVDLRGDDPQSCRALLATRPRSVIAFARDDVATTLPGPRWRPLENEVTRWCRLLEYHGIGVNPFRLDLPRPRAIPPGVRGATLIHPGTSGPEQPWPPERWVSVARSELAEGRHVVLTGSSAERPMISSIAHAAGMSPSAIHAGRTTLRTLAALVSVAGRVVCSDVGVGQLATAMGTPSVVLFGATSPHRWGPPGHRPWHRALWHGPGGDSEGTVPGGGLVEIGVDEVLEALATLPCEATPSYPLRWSA